MEKELEFDLKKLVEEVVSRPAPASCKEIEDLLLNLPPRNTLIKQTPTKEQIKAFELINEKLKNPLPEEILYMAHIYSFKYHRIRPGEGMGGSFELAKHYYGLYYDLTKSPLVKYILDNFDIFSDLIYKSYNKRLRKDDLARYKDDGYLSTSRDVDSTEWK